MQLVLTRECINFAGNHMFLSSLLHLFQIFCLSLKRRGWGIHQCFPNAFSGVKSLSLPWKKLGYGAVEGRIVQELEGLCQTGVKRRLKLRGLRQKDAFLTHLCFVALEVEVSSLQEWLPWQYWWIYKSSFAMWKKGSCLMGQ